MTNAEKYKTVEERTAAFNDYCKERQHSCVDCKIQTFTRDCRFRWLELEAPLTAKDVADILDGRNPYVNARLSEAFDRAIEILRSIEE